MRIYGIIWTGVVALLVAAAVAGAVVSTPWWGPVGTAGAASVLGWIYAALRTPDSGRRDRLRASLWFVAGGLLLVGLPALVGVWAVLVLAGVVVTAPPLVRGVTHAVRLRRPVRTPEALHELSDRDLEHRWQVSTARIRHPGTSVAVRLELASERAALLDEMERRRPGYVADLLGREPERGETSG